MEFEDQDAPPWKKRDMVFRAGRYIAMFAALLICYGLIRGPAMETTRSTLERQSASFLLISTLKSSLAVIEGSDIGVGFRLEVGDAVQSSYDLVDFTWKLLLYGILLITFSKILFESNLIHLGLYILGAGFALQILAPFVQRYRQRFVSLGSGVIAAGLIATFYIPVSALVSFRATEYFVEHIEKDLDQQMEQILSDWEKFKSDISMAEIKATLTGAAVFTKELFSKLTRILITFTCLLLIRYLMFPLVVAYGFLTISKTFLKKRFE
ncbi:MAG: hypothetical protein C4530_22805 [Desulfobacteraceae bacterium]|nr:MAG: hypothetical protein C4530_22805 [Desulfobacteraceae bacterium]